MILFFAVVALVCAIVVLRDKACLSKRYAAHERYIDELETEVLHYASPDPRWLEDPYISYIEKELKELEERNLRTEEKNDKLFWEVCRLENAIQDQRDAYETHRKWEPYQAPETVQEDEEESEWLLEDAEDLESTKSAGPEEERSYTLTIVEDELTQNYLGGNLDERV